MRRHRVAFAAALVLLSTLAHAYQAPAPDVSANWSGKFTSKATDGKSAEESAFAVLRQRGNELTGSVGPRPDRQQDIENGKVEATSAGVTVTFQTGREGHRIYFAMKLEGESLKGTARDEAYGTTLNVELSRVK